MKRRNWLISLGLSFLLLSMVIYYIHFLIFKDSLFIYRYLVAQLGFLPISTFLVTIVLNQLMGRREKNIRMQKLNMVIGAFFSDVGTDLLRSFAVLDPQANQYGRDLKINSSWSKSDFDQIKKRFTNSKLETKPDKAHLTDLNNFLAGKRNNLLRLLENPNLLEHESFSQLLRAIFHLTEELCSRNDLGNLPFSDYAHLKNDIERAYILLIHQWINYMEHLNDSYPYLFSLAVRTNPFDPEASVEVRE
jgi:hypothetical protein